MSVLSFDPGVRNLAVWAGTLSDHGEPITKHLEKYDLAPDPKSKKAVYEAAVDLVLETPWMSDPAQVSEAVVETQAPRNMPARVAATAIYGALRGRGIKTRFSGAQLKNKAMAALAGRLGCELEEKPAPLKRTDHDEKERAKRRRTMHRVNKSNAATVAALALSSASDDATLDKLKSARGPTGRVKMDDLSDALLLGVGLCLENMSKKCTTK
jgi:hypothetical protein